MDPSDCRRVSFAGRTHFEHTLKIYDIEYIPAHLYNACMGNRSVPERVGIVGGGQLGRMMILAGVPMGLEFGVVTPRPDDPAASLADFHVPGQITDESAIAKLADWADVITVEIEHVHLGALEAARRLGIPVHPSAAVLRTINDKLLQKQTLAAAGVPVPEYSEQASAFPVVQKARFGGYDGRGVAMLHSEADPALSGRTFFEEPIDIAKELAVIVWRGVSGHHGCYAPVEMEFDSRANICTSVLYPADISESVASDAAELAAASVAAIGAYGVVAVELFLDNRGRLLVNELAPRPHNSGHLTIDAFETSQFEQHLRAIIGLPAGSVRALTPAVTRNLLGGPDSYGRASVDAVSRLFGAQGAHVHWYGKAEVKPFRKMGHVTVTADTRADAVRRLAQLADAVWVSAREEGGGGDG